MHYIINDDKFDDSLIQYGDGLFETMLAKKKEIHHWKYHCNRLQSSCDRLQIMVPNLKLLYQQIQDKLDRHGNDFSVIKMIISRGRAMRGYRTIDNQYCYVRFKISSCDFIPTLYKGALIRVCKTRLSSQPLLSGMKHTNRLEYVMARKEENDSLFDEGLLLDYDDYIIEGLISNIFMIYGRDIYTPILDKSGVAGTMRAYLIKYLSIWGFNIELKRCRLNDLIRADAVFLTNAIAGVIPVKKIEKIDKVFDLDIVDKIRNLVRHPFCEK